MAPWQAAMLLFKDIERRDPAEILGDGALPQVIQWKSQREFVRKVVEAETQLRKDGTQFVDEAQEPESSRIYREEVNAAGCPSETVSATYHWTPGTELMRAPAQHEPVA